MTADDHRRNRFDKNEDESKAETQMTPMYTDVTESRHRPVGFDKPQRLLGRFSLWVNSQTKQILNRCSAEQNKEFRHSSVTSVLICVICVSTLLISLAGALLRATVKTPARTRSVERKESSCTTGRCGIAP